MTLTDAFGAEDSKQEAEAALTGALAHFLPNVEASREQFGFSPDDKLSALKIEPPIPAVVLDATKLSKSAQPESVADFTKAVQTLWAPVSLQDHYRGILCVTKGSEDAKWIPLDFGRAPLARLLGIYAAKYPPAKHSWQIVLSPTSPDVYLHIGGLNYDSLILLDGDEAAARRLAARPPPAKSTLLSIRASLEAGLGRSP